MIKREEASNPNSCLNKSQDDEPLFVICARDEAFVNTVKKWIRRRIKLGLNKPGDRKVADAESLIEQAREWRKTNLR